MSKFGLTGLKGKLKIEKVAVFDIESSNWIDFRILGFFDGVDYYEFYKTKDFLNFILKDKYRQYKIYAHNGGKFDFRFLLNDLSELGNKVDILDVNGSLIQLKIHLVKRDYIILRDSYVLLPDSLRNLTKSFNVEHQKQYIDDYNFDEITDKKREYLKYDCFGLYEVIMAFQNKINSIGGNIKLTTASTAMDLFRRKYFPVDLPFIARYPNKEEKIRLGYYGGRTEVFRRYYNESEPLYLYDFNSLYPAVMAENDFPVGNPVSCNNYVYNKKDTGFVKIKVTIPELFVPPLPVKSKNLLQFPIGKIVGWYPIPFMEVLNSLNIKFSIQEAILFNKRMIFKDYVNELYKVRMENKNNSLNYITKIMLNSTYGKFAQNVLRQEFIQNPKNVIGLTNFDLDLNLFFRLKSVDAVYILPAISAYVTAYAQIKIFKVMNLLQESLYYCDTDSIITTTKINTSSKLGELKLEHTIKKAIFLTQKVYAYIDDKGKYYYKAKGYSKDFCNELKYSDFENALLKNDLSAFSQEYKALWGLRESLKRRNTPLVFDYKKKSIINLETKRRFVENFLTKPLQLVS